MGSSRMCELQVDDVFSSGRTSICQPACTHAEESFELRRRLQRSSSRVAYAPVTVTHGRVRLNQDAVLVAEGDHLPVLPVRVHLDLVDGRVAAAAVGGGR